MDSPPARLEKDNSWIITSLRGADSSDVIEVDLEDSFAEKAEAIAVLTTQDGADEFVAITISEEDDRLFWFKQRFPNLQIYSTVSSSAFKNIFEYKTGSS